MTRLRLQSLVRMIEKQSPGVSFYGLCLLLSETVWCRTEKMTAPQIRLRLIGENIETVCGIPAQISIHNLPERLHTAPKRPFCVSYGMGVDSTALLVWLVRMYHSEKSKRPAYRPDLITFADTGNEKKETYDYLPVIQGYLKRSGFPQVEVVRYKPEWTKNGDYHTLEQNCLVNRTLPSLAFGFKKCSLKWKRGPQDACRKQFQPCVDAWAAGMPSIVAIGYDAGPKDAKRRWDITDDEMYEYIYPLVELGWDRQQCLAEIRQERLPGWEDDSGGKWMSSGGVPVKSACWFCPATQPEELIAFSRTPHGRDYLRAIIRMEENALPNLTKIEGLWRNGVKGNRGGKAKPGSMTQFILENGLLDERRYKPLPIVTQFSFGCSEQCSGCF